MGLDHRLIDLTHGTRRWIATVVILGWLIVVLNVAQIMFIGKLITEALDGISGFGWLFIIFAIIIPVRAVLNWAVCMASHRASAQTKLLLRDRMYEHLLKLGPGFLESKSTGALVQTAVEGVEALDVYFGKYLPQFILGMSIPLLLCAYIATVDWVTAAALLICLPIIPVSLIMIQRKLQAVSKRYWTSAGRLSTQFLDSLQGLATLKMFNRSQTRADEIHAQTEQFRQDTMRLLSINLISLFFIDWVSTLGTTVVACGMAAWRLQIGALTFNEAIMLTLLGVELARPLILLGSYFHAGASGVSAAQHISAILDTQIQIREKQNAFSPARCKSHIRFEKICFSYKEGELPALDDISFEINPGEMIAIVGASGAGKSSLINLLFRFFDPQSGQITMDGYPIKDMSLDWLRQQMALVTQNTYLFYGTIAENLQLGKPEATKAEIKAAAQAANIHNFISSLPSGYETQISERGLSLSGGQAQRIAIARAILKNTSIMILDEATSNVDMENELIIQEALERLFKHKTILVIAHRLSTIRRADRILVMDKGQLVESGTHEYLLNKQGIYAQLTSNQRISMQPTKATV